MRNEVKEAFLLGWDNHLTYSSDYTNSMIGQGNSLLQKMKSAQSDQTIFEPKGREPKNFLEMLKILLYILSLS